MEESQKFFESTTPAGRGEALVSEPDRTLATPRFGEVEAQVARPVVPLAGRPAPAGGKRRRQWPIALVLISALAGGVVSLLAFRMYQQRSQVVAAEVDGQKTTPAPDAAAADSSAPAPESVTETGEQAQSDAPVMFEEFDPAKEGGAVSDAAPARPKVTAEAAPTTSPARPKNETKVEPKPAAPRAAEPKPRLVETIAAPRQAGTRQEDAYRDDRRAEDDDFADRRRERRRQRREERRGQRRNIDRIKDIFEGAPPS